MFCLSLLLLVIMPGMKQQTFVSVHFGITLKSAKSTGKQSKEAESDESRAEIELQHLGKGPTRGEGKFTDYGIFLIEYCSSSSPLFTLLLSAIQSAIMKQEKLNA